MPVVRYFLFVGAALLTLLFIVDACLPKLPAADNVNTAANMASDLSVIRIHSDRKWPERVEFDTSRPTITAAPAALAEANVRTDAPARMRDAFAQLQTTQVQTSEVQTSEAKKPEPKLPPKRRIVASKRVANRMVARNQIGQPFQIGPPMMLVAQQPRPGFFPNTMW
jgi:hypothetical protein